MLFSGITSNTFRSLDFQKVIGSTKIAQLEGVEWECDVHVPLGNVQMAEIIKKQTLDAGLKIFSIGSYFKAGDSYDASKAFLPVIDCAQTLKTPVIRVWVGSRSSVNCDEEYYKKVLKDTKTICNMAWRAAKTVCFESHRGTLSDSPQMILRLIKDAETDNLKMNWKPNREKTFEENQADLRLILPHLQHIHVSNKSQKGDGILLSEAAEEWKRYIEIIRQNPKNKCFFLRFIMNDGFKRLDEDAALLNSWIRP